MPVIAGKSLTLLTVSKNDSVAVAPDLSVTVSVIVDEPYPLLAGVIVTVRLAPVPLMAMFAFGISVVLLDAALIVRLPSASSMSPIVN